MAWVQTIPEEQATGDLAIVYGKARDRAGVLPNIARLQSLRPGALSRSFDLYCQLMDAPGGLSRRERVLIATVEAISSEVENCVAASMLERAEISVSSITMSCLSRSFISMLSVLMLSIAMLYMC